MAGHALEAAHRGHGLLLALPVAALPGAPLTVSGSGSGDREVGKLIGAGGGVGENSMPVHAAAAASGAALPRPRRLA